MPPKYNARPIAMLVAPEDEPVFDDLVISEKECKP